MSEPDEKPDEKEFVEDFVPLKHAAYKLSEDVAPHAYSLYDTRGIVKRRESYPTKRPKATHDQITRRWLALLIIGTVGIINVAIFGFFLTGNITSDELTNAIASLAGPQALAAAAVGFYYADRKGR